MIYQNNILSGIHVESTLVKNIDEIQITILFSGGAEFMGLALPKTKKEK